GKASMSFLTALSLSFNNLKSKKGRTFLTAFAGSIGIIGIALILSLSTGVNDYIDNIQQDTMTAYPITIEAESIDLDRLVDIRDETIGDYASSEESDVDHDLDGIYSNTTTLELISSTSSTFKENNLTSFKKYLEDPSNEIEPYVGANGIVYSYAVNFDLFTYDEEETFINTDGSTFTEEESQEMSGFQMPPSPMMSSESNVSELIPGVKDNLISQVITDNYDVLYGKWPENYDEVVLTVDQNNEINTAALYELGILPANEYEDILEQIDKGEKIEVESQKLSYEEIADQVFYLLPASEYYVKDEHDHFESVSDDEAAVENLVEDKAIEIKISGIVKPIEDATTTAISTPIAYTNALTKHLIDYANESDIVQAQEESPEINVLNGLRFEAANDDQKIEDTREYLASLTISEKADFVRSMQESDESAQMPDGMPTMSEEQLAASFDSLVETLDSETLLSIYDNSISAGSYDDNMEAFGVVSLDAPSSISIYADNFEDKEAISAGIDDYNASVDDEEKITYADFAGLIMSSVTEIINVITYVLIAFVSVSLVVSSIMIGIITYISVLERTKEI